MSLAVVTVAAGGLPVVDATASGLGLPVSESTAKFGLAVTKVAAGGRPVVYAPANSDGSGPVTPPFTPGTWNPSDKSAALVLSNGNLTATGTAFSTLTVRAGTSLSTGKYYCELTFVTVSSTATAFGLAPPGAALPVVSTTAGTTALNGSGVVLVGGTQVVGSMGSVNNGTVGCMAVDLGAKLVWFRLGAAGNWNGSAGNNPATGVGGQSISTLALPLVPFFCQASPNPGQVGTANFGASAFVGTVPSGFTAGWPA